MDIKCFKFTPNNTAKKYKFARMATSTIIGKKPADKVTRRMLVAMVTHHRKFADMHFI